MTEDKWAFSASTSDAAISGGPIPPRLPPIAAITSFHVAGTIHEIWGMPEIALTSVPGSPPLMIDPNGQFMAGQMYVQSFKLVAPTCPYPVMLWHGGGLTGACWEETPDGRAGWLNALLRLGYDVFVSDAVERGRAGWAQSPQIYPGAAFFMPMHAAWELYRVGPATGFSKSENARAPFPQSRFPVAHYNQFMRQVVPRFQGNETVIQAAYDTYLTKCGPAILVAHSQGASFAVEAALRQPESVKAIVLVEPGGMPDPQSDRYDAIADIPMLVIWGDNVDAVPFWAKAKALSKELAARRDKEASTTNIIDLPETGVFGNSHLLMMDENSEEIAAEVSGWIQKNLT